MSGRFQGRGAAWVRHNRILRPLAVGGYRFLARTVLTGRGPRTLANSIPKAGTHLLSALLVQFPDLRFSGRHHVLQDFSDHPPTHANALPEIDWSSFRRELGRTRPGQFATAHLPYLPAAQSILHELDYRHVLMIRDPRDIVVSLAKYITHTPRHFLHHRFRDEFHSDDERLMACIVGLPLDRKAAGIPDIGTTLRHWMPWREDGSTYVCRYEDLLGVRGGGSSEKQIQEILRIGRHLGRDFSVDDGRAMGERVWSSRSPTFRSGKIADWRGVFTPEHVEAMRDLALVEMAELGYTSW